jgi:[protein-PII] uridylyltransferase
VKTERRLVALYLLTVADIRGTSPKVWNAWRGKLLEDLFRNTRRLLRGGDLQQDQEFEAKRQEALRLLRLYGLSDDAPESFWQQLDVPYFLRHDPEDIAWQTRNLHYRVNAPEAIVKARLSPAGEGIQVMIYMPDQRDLFARICGYFGSINLNIVDARIHTTRHGYALDTFQVMEQGDGQHYREMLAMIEHDLTERLQKRGDLPNPSRGRASRQSRHFPISPEVQIVPDEKAQYYLVSIIAADRPGLLYAIATLFGRYSLSLHTAKIVTLGERAEDAFLVSGEGLSNSRVVLLLEQDLLELLQG